MQLQWLKPYFAVWNILKQYYKKPQMLMYLLAILILFSTLLSVFLPYLMKQIVDISQLDRERLSFQPLWNWNNLYILATAYVLGWLFSNILLTFIRAQVSTLVVMSHAIYAKQFADHLIDLDALTEISAKKASE